MFLDAVSTNMSPLNGAWFIVGSLHCLTPPLPVRFFLDKMFAGRKVKIVKRNMDLVRDILLAVERGETYFKGGDENEVAAHIKMLEGGGLIYGYGRNLWGMTWDGYNLLDAMRDESLWKTAKAALMREGMSWTIELLKSWVTDQLKRQLHISSSP